MGAREEKIRHASEALSLGRYEQASEAIALLQGTDPEFCDTLYLAGLSALGEKKFGLARFYITQAYEQRLWVRDRICVPMSVELLGEAIRNIPDWDWARYQLARERWRTVDLSVVNAVRALAEKSKKVQTFVQVGANDGRSGDPLHDLIMKGELKGLLIEPQPEPFEKLKEHYEGVDGLKFEKAAVTEEDGEVEMVTAVSRTTIGSLVPERGLLGRYGGNMKTVSVPGKRFERMLEEHGIKQFDVLQIDTEGFDYNVLKQVDLARYGVKCVNMEYYHLPVEERLLACRLLEKAGFAFSCSYMDLLAVHRETLSEDFLVTDLLAIRGL